MRCWWTEASKNVSNTFARFLCSPQSSLLLFLLMVTTCPFNLWVSIRCARQLNGQICPRFPSSSILATNFCKFLRLPVRTATWAFAAGQPTYLQELAIHQRSHTQNKSKIVEAHINRTSIFAKLQSFLPVLNGNIFAFHLFSVCHSWQNSSLESHMDHTGSKNRYWKKHSVQALRRNITPSPDSGSLWTSPISLRFCTATWWTNLSHSLKQCRSGFPRAWHWKKFRSLYYQWWVFPQVTSTELCPPQICHEVPIPPPNLLLMLQGQDLWPCPRHG